MGVHYFEYDGQSSENLQINPYETLYLTFGYFGTYEPPLNLARNALVGSINRTRLRNRAMGAQWANPLQFELSIVKSYCHHAEEDLIFTEDDVDFIATWLTSPDYPALLHIYEADDESYLEDQEAYSNLLYMKYDYYGIFTDITPQYNGGDIVGLTAVFTTNSPFAWTKPITVTQECRGSTDLTITVNSSEKYGEIYPLIEIKGYNEDAGTERGEEITITNNDDLALNMNYDHQNGYNSTTTPRSIHLVVPHSEIYLDSEHAKIYDIISVQSMNYNRLLDWQDLGLTDVSYIYWPRLFHGENHWTITGDCDITITYREPRKVGAY